MQNNSSQREALLEHILENCSEKDIRKSIKDLRFIVREWSFIQELLKTKGVLKPSVSIDQAEENKEPKAKALQPERERASLQTRVCSSRESESKKKGSNLREPLSKSKDPNERPVSRTRRLRAVIRDRSLSRAASKEAYIRGTRKRQVNKN